MIDASRSRWRRGGAWLRSARRVRDGAVAINGTYDSPPGGAAGWAIATSHRRTGQYGHAAPAARVFSMRRVVEKPGGELDRGPRGRRAPRPRRGRRCCRPPVGALDQHVRLDPVMMRVRRVLVEDRPRRRRTPSASNTSARSASRIDWAARALVRPHGSSEFTATISASPSPRASCRYRTCPGCSRSNTPLVKTTRAAARLDAPATAPRPPAAGARRSACRPHRARDPDAAGEHPSMRRPEDAGFLQRRRDRNDSSRR